MEQLEWKGNEKRKKKWFVSKKKNRKRLERNKGLKNQKEIRQSLYRKKSPNKYVTAKRETGMERPSDRQTTNKRINEIKEKKGNERKT